ncbi:MAG: RNA pseudouridine synthase [Sphaerochaetaceae bacterium]|nr:RNA pseudouridine synthase [Sphaerochaetaceae bacterium]
MSSDIFDYVNKRVLYEDNHLIIINKLPGEIVQADKTGDITLMEDVKEYLKIKYNKPGNVYLGLPHRLDRPTSGAVVFAKTDKALTRLSEMFRKGDIEKHYWAVVDKPLVPEQGLLTHYLYRDASKNKSFAYKTNNVRGVPAKDLQEARLEYKQIGQSERYTLLDIRLLTGRHHQIRAQLAACGVHIKGDLKYGFARSNPDGGICLHSHEISFIHPVSKESIHVVALPPADRIWDFFNIL